MTGSPTRAKAASAASARRRRRGVVIACVVVAAAPPAAARAAVVKPVEWRMPARTHGTLGPHRTFVEHMFQSADQRLRNICCSVHADRISPPAWTVEVDACGSTPSPGEKITEYTFQAVGTIYSSSGSACSQRLRLGPQNGADYDVRAVVSESDHRQTAGPTTRVTVRDLLVVSLGDSYASGEGANDYYDHRCDRSRGAGPALAALRLEESSAHSSVTLIHLACSGAKVEKFANQAAGHGGLVDGYAGVNRIDHEILDPQVPE